MFNKDLFEHQSWFNLTDRQPTSIGYGCYLAVLNCQEPILITCGISSCTSKLTESIFGQLIMSEYDGVIVMYEYPANDLNEAASILKQLIDTMVAPLWGTGVTKSS